jgi:L-lysine exporter family protein LysE/ArgO
MSLEIFLEGLLLQASLILALGAQNLFILESGLKKHYPIGVSFVCFFCDLLLITLGVAGAASVFNVYPELKILIGALGAIFLFQYGLSKVLNSDRGFSAADVLGDKSLKKSILLAVTFSILNPHAYLDAFVLIGGFSSKYAELNDRLLLGFGAAIFSLLWFLMLSGASTTMKPLLANPKRLRFFMTTAGLCLMYLSGKLGFSVLDWMSEGEMGPKITSLIDYPLPPGKVFTSILF